MTVAGTRTFRNRHSDVRQVELIDLVARFAPADGLHDTVIAPLQLLRASAPAQGLPTVYEPGLCVVVQGRKQAMLAGEVFRYDPLHYPVISVTIDAASAGHRVGYESPSQFSREYRHLFGAPPRAEIEQVRSAVQS